jgi:hypothetical protein
MKALIMLIGNVVIFYFLIFNYNCVNNWLIRKCVSRVSCLHIIQFRSVAVFRILIRPIEITNVNFTTVDQFEIFFWVLPRHPAAGILSHSATLDHSRWIFEIGLSSVVFWRRTFFILGGVTKN